MVLSKMVTLILLSKEYKEKMEIMPVLKFLKSL